MLVTGDRMIFPTIYAKKYVKTLKPFIRLTCCTHHDDKYTFVDTLLKCWNGGLINTLVHNASLWERGLQNVFMGGVSGKNRPRMFQVCVKIKKHKWNEPANLEKLSLSKAFREHKSIDIGKYSSVQFQFIILKCIYNAVIVQSLFKSAKLKPLN